MTQIYKLIRSHKGSPFARKCPALVEEARMMPETIKRLFCLLNIHAWQPDYDWASRVCSGCGNVEILMYTRESGTFWERVT
jgi:hypothetical protein